MVGRTDPSASGSTPPKSIAVLPFVDLSEGMKNEEFADGVTEELIDRLSTIPGVRVPAPTASFYFKNKKLDGSVRKSGAKVRVAARLMRPDTGDILWSETYDRAWDDVLTVQDEIAGKMMNALAAAIDGGPER